MRSRAEQREGDGCRAKRPSSELPVCLLLLAHLLHHLDPPTKHHPPSTTLPLVSPIFLFTCGSLQQPGSLLVRRTKMEYRERGGGYKGFVFGACRQHTCCLKRADIRAQQETVDGEGMEGWTSFSSSHHFLSPCNPTDELDN